MPEQGRIDDIAVMGQGKIPRLVTEKERLDILDTTTAGRRIADVADGHRTGQRSQFGFIKNLLHQALALDAAQGPVLPAGYDAAAFLAAMLQGM